MVYRKEYTKCGGECLIAYPYLFKIAKFCYQGLAKHFH